MEVSMSFAADDMDPDLLQSLMFEVVERIRGYVDAELATRAAGPGERGDAGAVGAIQLANVTIGAAEGVLRVVRAVIEGRPNVHVELKLPGGSALVLDAEKVHPDQFDRTLERFIKGLLRFMEGNDEPGP